MRNVNIIDSTPGSDTKSSYTFAVVEQAGTGSSAVFGCYAFPVTTVGVGATGTRRFGITAGIMRGDTTIATTPNTRALIHGLSTLGN
jgi:hypothetical protein